MPGERTIRYLKGETLTAAEEEAADGLVLICVDGFPLGWAQKRGGQLKINTIPDGGGSDGTR